MIATNSSSVLPGSEQMQCLQLFGEEVEQQLSEGFLHLFQPELLHVQDSLRELTYVTMEIHV